MKPAPIMVGDAEFFAYVTAEFRKLDGPTRAGALLRFAHPLFPISVPDNVRRDLWSACIDVHVEMIEREDGRRAKRAAARLIARAARGAA